MKISELIKLLQEEQQKIGDLNVVITIYDQHAKSSYPIAYCPILMNPHGYGIRDNVAWEELRLKVLLPQKIRVIKISDKKLSEAVKLRQLLSIPMAARRPSRISPWRACKRPLADSSSSYIPMTAAKCTSMRRVRSITFPIIKRRPSCTGSDYLIRSLVLRS